MTTDNTAIGAPIAAPVLEVLREDGEGVGEVAFSDGGVEIVVVVVVVVVAEETTVTYDRAVLSSVDVEVSSMARIYEHISATLKRAFS